MKTLSALFAAAVLSLPSGAFAAPAGSSVLMNASHVEALSAIRAAMPRWTSIHMRADCWGGSSCSITESGQRINLNGHRTSWGSYSFNGWAGAESINVSADPDFQNDPRRGYRFFGGRSNLSLRPSGNGYWLTGFMGRRSVSITFDRFGSSWSMFGQSGLNLNLSGFNQTLTASGSVDLEQYGPGELAVFGAVLSVLSSLP